MQWEVICSHRELCAELHRESPGSCHALTTGVVFQKLNAEEELNHNVCVFKRESVRMIGFSVYVA